MLKSKIHLAGCLLVFVAGAFGQTPGLGTTPVQFTAFSNGKLPATTLGDSTG